MKISYSQLCSIREIVNKYDLEDLIDGCHAPSDEYYSEVDIMIEHIQSMDINSIKEVILNTIRKMFGYEGFENEYLNYKYILQMASEIREVLLQTKMTEVVAALIWDKENFLICQRPENKGCPLMWGFVDGKVEPGETKEQALIRECKEELAITISVGQIFMDVVHEYPNITVHLTLFNATIIEGVPQLLEHNDYCWITKDEINEYDFCPADEMILKKFL